MPDCNPEILVKDLAGIKYANPSYLQIRERINYLIKNYLSAGVLYSHLQNFYLSLKNTHHKFNSDLIDWQKINVEQVIGVSNDLFIDKIIRAVKLETITHDFETEIRDYLQAVNPQVTCLFETHPYLSSIEYNITLSKQEHQKSYLLRKIYKQLTGDELQLRFHNTKQHEFKGDLKEEIYNNALNRIVAEWSIISIYVWLMAHSTGELQKVILQPLQYEVNHLAKFWGISYWAFSDSFLSRLQSLTKNLTDSVRSSPKQEGEKDEILQINYVLHCVEVNFTFTSVMMQLHQWHKTLEHLYLENLFARPNNVGQTN